ncbi:hypothetical protein [Metaclostridioides mangenotii]|uniref:hypothetical protein n=1 Tax=Metaclostridioides mangenotii TaxID=1540 RepID=UPI0028F0E1DC|nr:hypothetical protein [Clostridioides mangenotii]
MFESILKYLIGTGMITFLAKSFFEKWLDNKKAEYQAELGRQLEDFRIQKELISEQNRVKFTRLHEERALAIKELYSRLQDVCMEMDIYLNNLIEHFDKEDYLALKEYIDKNFLLAGKAVEKFVIYSRRNLIYFESEMADTLEEASNVLSKTMLKAIKPIRENNDLTEEDIKLIKLFNEEMPEIKKNLEDSFREILK